MNPTTAQAGLVSASTVETFRAIRGWQTSGGGSQTYAVRFTLSPWMLRRRGLAR